MITLAKNEIIRLSKLKMKKYRQEEKLFLVESFKLINEAIKAGNLPKTVFCTEEFKQKCKPSFSCEIVGEKVLNKLCSSESPQGCVALFDFLEQKELSEGDFLVLDRIQDPSNVGAILRSALGADFCDIFLIDCADIYDYKVLRASMGAIFHLNIIKTSEEKLIDKLTSDKSELICLDMKGENIFKEHFSGKIGFVVGNEGSGVSENLKSFATKKVAIPMNEKLESLNAAVSASIVMYEASNRKGLK